MPFNSSTSSALLERPVAFVRDPSPVPAAVVGGCPVGEATDEALALAACSGDVEAFGVLYARYVDRVRAYMVNRRLGDADTCQDMTQEVFVQALEDLVRGKYAPDGQPNSFRRWLFGAEAHVVVTHYFRERWTQRNATESAMQAAEEDMRHEPAYPGGGSIGWEDLTDTGIKAACAGLTAKRRRALELLYLEGLSQEQAAEVMGAGLLAVKQLRNRAIEQLRANETVRARWSQMPSRPKRQLRDQRPAGSSSFAHRPNTHGTWIGTVWVPETDGSTRPRRVCGKDRDTTYARWQQLRAQVLAEAGECAHEQVA